MSAFLHSFARSLASELADPGANAEDVRRAAILGYLIGRERTAAEIASALSLPLSAVALDLDALANMVPARVEPYAGLPGDTVWWSLPEWMDGPARKAAGAVILASPPQQETITPQAAA